MERNSRKVYVGRVVSAKNDKKMLNFSEYSEECLTLGMIFLIINNS